MSLHREDGSESGRSASVLDAYWQGCKRVLADAYMTQGLTEEEADAAAERAKPPMPVRGSLDIGQVIESAYFFS